MRSRAAAGGSSVGLARRAGAATARLLCTRQEVGDKQNFVARNFREGE